MMSDEDSYKRARILAVALLNLQTLRTEEIIRVQAALAIQTAKAAGGGDVDLEQLVADLMHSGNVHVPDATMMDDPTDHIEWLPAKRGQIEWRFWSRYRMYLEQEKGLPEEIVERSVHKIGRAHV